MPSSIADPAERAKLRPFRVFMYAIYFVFTLGFIGCVIVSVAREVYGTPRANPNRAATPQSCLKEIEGLFGELDNRANLAVSPGRQVTWDDFQRHFDDAMEDVKHRCTESSVAQGAVHDSLVAAVNQLESLRGHVAICGREGEKERVELANALTALRDVVKPGR